MKSLQILAAIAAMSTQYDLPSEKGRNKLRPEDIDMTPKKKIIPKGCKIFNINGEEIVAINEKSAQRKYRSILKKSSPDQVK
jgi:hypothetical protein